MEKENLRVTISKRMMKEGLLRCLKRTSIDKLSLTELCRESGINRATFYNHYQLPKDILEEISWDNAREMKEIFESKPWLPLEIRMTQCFEYIYENREMVKLLFSANADSYLAAQASEIFSWAWSQIIDLKEKFDLDEDEYRLTVTAYGWAAYYIIRQWVMEDIQKTPEEITKLFIKLPGRKIYE